jgi:hypothetical protein
MKPAEHLQVRRSTTSQAALRRFGGVYVTSATCASLKVGLDALENAVLQAARNYPSVDRALLITDVAALLGHRVDLKVFNAVVGGHLRLGLFDSVPCAALTGKVFRALVLRERLAEWHANLHHVRGLLESQGYCSVNVIRDRVLMRDDRGMWSAANHLAARLVLLGRAEYKDRFSIRQPEGIRAVSTARG